MYKLDDPRTACRQTDRLRSAGVDLHRRWPDMLIVSGPDGYDTP